MDLYTIDEIKKNILYLNSKFKFLGSVADGENIFLLYGTSKFKVKNIRLIKVCWANNMMAVFKKGNFRVTRYTDVMQKTQIDKKYHLFEIIQLEEEMTINDFEYVADKAFSRIDDDR